MCIFRTPGLARSTEGIGMKNKNVMCVLLALASSSVALAQQIKLEDQIEYRQGAMTLTARSLGVLGAMVKGDMPFNKDVAARHAAVISDISDLPLTLGAFGPGTDKGAQHKASPKIWSEADKFKAAYEKFAAEARKLPAAAADVGTLKVAVGDVGKTCKGCHDDFRQK